MTNKLLILALFLSIFGFGQESKIVKILNDQFQAEQKMYDAGDPEKPQMIQPFQIQNGILSFACFYRYEDKEVHYHRAVPLDKVSRLDRDINVILFTENDDVKETVKEFDKKGELVSETTTEYHLFFVEIRKEFGNEKFRNKLLKAFQNAGYAVSNEYWAD